MALGKQAKTLNVNQQKAVLNYLSDTRLPVRNKVIFLLSLKAGLRAKEIASLTWSMVTDGTGDNIADAISLTDKASKGSSGGIIPLNNDLAFALNELLAVKKSTDTFVIRSQRKDRMTAQTIVDTFANWYRALAFDGCSSHSGRRTFITNAAKKITAAGGSIKDVQMLARHSSLNMTQTYIDHDVDAMRKVVNMI